MRDDEDTVDLGTPRQRKARDRRRDSPFPSVPPRRSRDERISDTTHDVLSVLLGRLVSSGAKHELAMEILWKTYDLGVSSGEVALAEAHRTIAERDAELAAANSERISARADARRYRRRYETATGRKTSEHPPKDKL